MNRFLQIFNLLGVVSLAILSGFQWQANSGLSHQADALQATDDQQASKLIEQDQTIKDDATSIDDLRQRLDISESSLKDATAKVASLTDENTQLKSALDKWTAAVAQRDDALKQAGDQIQKLAADRNDTVQKYSDLVNKYNALVAGDNKGK